ncbi:MAG: glycoside hydrolase family 3 N-terminal domain-containing protein [Alphaproteobacteria bacterium]
MTRIDSLLTAMTLEEKIGQLTMIAANAATTGPTSQHDLPAAIRAGRVGSVLNLWGSKETSELQRIALSEGPHPIPLFFGLDVLHGFKTIFPIPLAEAAAFEDELWEKTARAAAVEAAEAGIHLTFAPMLDICRDPRWGRIAEGPGEDPVLGARFAGAKVRGFQGTNQLRGSRLFATAKHFVAYGAAQAGREYASVDISERTLHEVYLPPFRAAVRAGVAAIMPAFNDIAGVPMSANRTLLRELVREKWGFEGVFISDYNAIAELIKHGVARDLAEAAALALKAGIDIDMMGGAYERGLPVALAREPALIGEIDAAVRRVLKLKEELGLFATPIRPSGSTAFAAPAARRALAREAASRSIVLLSNRGVLPLKSAPRRVAVIGPLAAERHEMLGPWAMTEWADDTINILDGIKAALLASDVVSANGVSIDGNDDSGIAAAVQLANTADLIVLCLGEAASMSGEAASRSQLDLPGRQEMLARAVFDAGKPVVAVLSSGRPLTVPWLFDRAEAVLSTWFLGSEAGHAIADILTGARSPTGKLPISWPHSVGQVPIFHAQRASGRPANPSDKFTSKYLDVPNEPQFAFGHGLTYTQFSYSNLRVGREELPIGDPLDVTVDVTNTGARPGEETVLLFIHDVVASVAQPVLAFRASAKIALAPGETRPVSLTLPADAFALVGRDLNSVIEPGEMEILVGPRAERQELLQAKVRLIAR